MPVCQVRTFFCSTSEYCCTNHWTVTVSVPNPNIAMYNEKLDNCTSAKLPEVLWHFPSQTISVFSRLELKMEVAQILFDFLKEFLK